MDRTPVYGTEIYHVTNEIRVANFSGRDTGGLYGSNGSRYFFANLFEEDADRLRALGYPVRIYEGKHEDDTPVPFIKVYIKYRNSDGTLKPDRLQPKVYSVVDGQSPQLLDETTIAELDTFMDGRRIKDCSFTMNLGYPHGRPVPYLETGYFVCDSTKPTADRERLRVDPFASMYNR